MGLDPDMMYTEQKSFICLSGEKSVGMERSVSGFVWVRGVLQQAFAMVTRDADEAANLKSKAAADFEKVIARSGTWQRPEILNPTP